MKTSGVLLALISSAAAAPRLSSKGHGASSNTAVWDRLRGQIKHVIYIMMENHSFDNIAGQWDFHPDINNLVGKEMDYCNPYTNPLWTVYDEPINICPTPYDSEVPFNDPDHDFAGTNFEIYRTYYPNETSVPTMMGFADRESVRFNSTPGDAAFVVRTYDKSQTQTLQYIAQNFAFFDTYFAEHPGPTNPNRQFATSGSSCGYVDDTTQSAGFFQNGTGTTCAMSIFESLENAGISWANYYETDIIDAWNYNWTQYNAFDKLKHSNEFYTDLANGNLPQFSYYNPECCTMTSMHPSSNMAAGEALLKHIYDAVRNSPYWEETLLIINFDEHGGYFDHVAPPVNIPAPEDGMMFNGLSEGFNVTYNFTRLGLRVPAFIVSPLVAPNTLISSEGTMYASNSEYTHSSFLHFLQNLWELDGLNNRVQWAKTFEYVFGEKVIEKPTALPTPIWQGGSSAPQPAPFYELNQDYSYYANLP